MSIGFTGTREGMSSKQKNALHWFFDSVPSLYVPFHYGTHETATLIADDEASVIAKSRGCSLYPNFALRREELARNKRIVDEATILIAAPLVDVEQLRSGTWATIRYARKKGIPIVMLPR